MIIMDRRVAFAVLSAIGVILTGSVIGEKAEAIETPKTPKPPIVLGEFGPMSGPLGPLGISTDRGIRLAVDQINAHGGIDGHPIEVVLRDDEGTADGVTNALNQLTTYNTPTAIIGEVSSARSLQAARVCTEWRIPMISPGATDPQVTNISSYIFRTCFVDAYQGTVAAQFAVSDLHTKRAAILTDASSAYSQLLTEAFRVKYTQEHGQIVGKQTYRASDRDFRSQLKRLIASNPDVLYVPGNAAEAGPIVRQARELGLKCPILGGDGWISTQFVTDAGPALGPCYLTDHYSVEDANAANRVFISSYKKKYEGSVPDALAAMGYESVYLLAAALKHTPKPIDGDYTSVAYHQRLRDTLATTHDFRGLLGRLRIDKDRNPVKPAVILKIQGNDFRFVRTISAP